MIEAKKRLALLHLAIVLSGWRVEAVTFEIGTRLERYETLSQLGAGGMGEVYLARDTKLDRKVALKILPVTADGQRFLFVSQTQETASLQYTVVVNWTADLKR